MWWLFGLTAGAGRMPEWLQLNSYAAGERWG